MTELVLVPVVHLHRQSPTQSARLRASLSFGVRVGSSTIQTSAFLTDLVKDLVIQAHLVFSIPHYVITMLPYLNKMLFTSQEKHG